MINRKGGQIKYKNSIKKIMSYVLYLMKRYFWGGLGRFGTFWEFGTAAPNLGQFGALNFNLISCKYILKYQSIC